jgi:hypothetical protein
VRTVLRNLLRFLETFISTNWLARRTNLTVHGMHLPRLTKGPFFWKKKIGLISESVKQRGLIHASHSRPSRRFTLVLLPLVSCTKKCYLSSWRTKRFDEQTENFPTPNTLQKKDISGPGMALDLEKNVISNHTNCQSLVACCHAHAQGLVWTAPRVCFLAVRE